MVGELLDLIRMNQEALCGKGLEQAQQLGSHVAALPSGVLQRSFAGMLEVLLAYWERGEEAEARAWAEQQVQVAAEAGVAPAEIVGALDLLAKLVRLLLQARFTRRSALLAALALLEEGSGVLRRCYLEAYGARMPQRAVPLQAGKAVDHHACEFQVLYEFSQAVGYTLNADELMQLLLARLVQVVPHDVAAGILISGSLCNLYIRPRRPLSAVVQEEIQQRLFHSLALMNDRARRLKQGRLHVRLLEADDFDAVSAPMRRMGSAFQVPLLVGQNHEVVGLLFLGTEQEGTFTEDRERLLYTIVHHAAFSMQRLRALLAEAEQRRESLVEHLPEGVLMVDAERCIVLANPTAKAYLAALTDVGVGEVLSHLAGRPLHQLLQPPTEVPYHEVEVEGPPRRVFEVKARPLAGGPASGRWLLVLRDATTDRQVQERVQQQERLAAVGQLAAGIAHDFNNLLTGIIGFADLLQKRPDMPEPARARLARIVEQGERGAHLVRQVLDFSRTAVSQLQPLDLVSFLKEVSKFLERTIPESMRIVVESAPGTYMVRADPSRMRQVLTNLAVNAYDAMPEGGDLALRLSHFTRQPGELPPCLGMPAGEWVVLAVSDTGTGIVSEALPHIFEPFFTTKEPGKGTGLGLAQVYGIVKQHDGYIRAESQEEVGTTIVIYLPALAVHRETHREEVLEDIPQAHGETVMLVEDEPVVLEVCQVMLEHLGYRVLTATNGQQALAVYIAHQHEIALVLMDMVMPVMGGVQLFQALRELQPSVKAVVMTGYPLEEEGRQLLAEGILAWIQKPLNPTQLAQTLRRVLREEE
jgi:signal transduction histidine kinase/ActR/RegA family two-component response regulator